MEGVDVTLTLIHFTVKQIPSNVTTVFDKWVASLFPNVQDLFTLLIGYFLTYHDTIDLMIDFFKIDLLISGWIMINYFDLLISFQPFCKFQYSCFPNKMLISEFSVQHIVKLIRLHFIDIYTFIRIPRQEQSVWSVYLYIHVC